MSDQERNDTEMDRADRGRTLYCLRICRLFLCFPAIISLEETKKDRLLEMISGVCLFVKEKPGKCKKNVKKYCNAGEICAIVEKNV